MASRWARNSSGSTVCSTTLTAPTRKPPRAAPRRLPMPPITVATKAMITSGHPILGNRTPTRDR